MRNFVKIGQSVAKILRFFNFSRWRPSAILDLFGGIGHDGICSEHFKYAGTDLLVHMCLLFNAMLCHSFVPSDFCFGMIMPLLKDKHGNASKI